jgi:hypothetical protein
MELHLDGARSERLGGKPDRSRNPELLASLVTAQM